MVAGVFLLGIFSFLGEQLQEGRKTPKPHQGEHSCSRRAFRCSPTQTSILKGWVHPVPSPGSLSDAARVPPDGGPQPWLYFGSPPQTSQVGVSGNGLGEPYFKILPDDSNLQPWSGGSGLESVQNLWICSVLADGSSFPAWARRGAPMLSLSGTPSVPHL